MFNFFKKKSQIDRLNDQYKKLQKEAFELSSRNRTESDRKFAESEQVMNEIERLVKAKKEQAT